MMRRSVLPALIVLLGGASVCAQPAPQTASDWIDRGRDLARRRQFDQAIVALRHAYDMQPTPESEGFLGLTEAAQAAQTDHGWLTAEGHLEGALAHPNDPWVTSSRQALDSTLARVRQHLGTLSLRCGVEGARVSLDGQDAVLPLDSRRVELHELHLRFTASGYQPRDASVTPRAGETTTASCELRPTQTVAQEAHPRVVVVQTPPPPPPPNEPRSGAGRTAAWVTGVGALVAGGVGLIFWQLRDSQADHWNSDECLSGDLTRGASCPTTQDAISTDHGVMLGGFIVGGALAVTSAVLFATSGTSSRSERAFVCAPGLAGASCVVRF